MSYIPDFFQTREDSTLGEVVSWVARELERIPEEVATTTSGDNFAIAFFMGA